MSNYAVKIEVQFETMTCVNCGLEFATKASFFQERRRDARAFYCPNGHPQGWWTSEADKLRKQLEQANRERDAARANQKMAENRERAAKAAHTRLVKTGCCPCCRRNFTNLRRHMKTQHPDYTP